MIERVFIPQVDTLEALRNAIVNSLNNTISRLNRDENKLLDVLDANHHRVINLARPTTGNDAVSLSYLREVLGKVRTSRNTFVDGAGVVVGTHSSRPTSSQIGSVYFESDRQILYIYDGEKWVYISGVMSGTLSPNQKPADLTSDGDIGFIFRSTDYFHDFLWNGTGWEWANPGDPSGRIVGFITNPGDGWVLVSGSAISYSTSSGGTSSVTPDSMADTFAKWGAYSGSVAAAVLPAGTTGDADSGGSVNLGSGTTVQSGLGASVGSATGSISVTGSTHNHDLSGITDPGAPPSFSLLPYFRI